MIDLPSPSYEQTIAAIGACEIPVANVRITYEDELQSDVVTISDLGEVGEQKFRCLRQAVHPFYILMIENTDQQAAFYEFDRREARPIQKAQAVEFLRARGLLDRVPSFDSDEGVAGFARALEASCDVPVGSALTSLDSDTLTFRLDFVQRLTTAEAFDTPGCLMRMFTASDAEDHGIRLVFVGNEAARDVD
jgi:hypothetical protein